MQVENTLLSGMHARSASTACAVRWIQVDIERQGMVSPKDFVAVLHRFGISIDVQQMQGLGRANSHLSQAQSQAQPKHGGMPPAL